MIRKSTKNDESRKEYERKFREKYDRKVRRNGCGLSENCLETPPRT